jgi:hypothetical protein
VAQPTHFLRPTEIIFTGISPNVQFEICETQKYVKMYSWFASRKSDVPIRHDGNVWQ